MSDKHTQIFLKLFKIQGENWDFSHHLYIYVTTFIAFFTLTGSTCRLPHFPTLIESPLRFRNFWHFLMASVIWDECSVIKTSSSVKAITETSWSLIFIPIPRLFNFSVNSSSVRLKRSDERGHPCLTPELVLICLVVFPPTVVDVKLFEYISIMVEVTFWGTHLRFKLFIMDLWYTVSNALAKSTKTVLYSFLLRHWFLMSFCRVFTFSKQPSTGTNHFFLIFKLIFLRSHLSQIFAYNLIHRFPVVIGCQLEEFLSSSTVSRIRAVLHSLTLSSILCPHHLLSIAAISWKVYIFKSGPDGVFFLNSDMQILTSSGVILP